MEKEWIQRIERLERCVRVQDRIIEQLVSEWVKSANYSECDVDVELSVYVDEIVPKNDCK